MATYRLNIGGQSWDAFEAPDDITALVHARELLDAGPHGDPADGPATIIAGVFDDATREYIGEVSLHLA